MIADAHWKPSVLDFRQLVSFHVQRVKAIQSYPIANSAMNEGLVADTRDGETSSRQERRAADGKTREEIGLGIVFVEVVGVKYARS